MSDFIPLSVPNFQGNELEYVSEAIKTEWVSTGGAFIKKLEEDLASYIHAEEVCALQSGTAALHLALRLSDVKEGDEVLSPALTFIAGVNPIKYLGAEPVFMDCTHNLCLDVDKVQEFLENECDFDGQILFNKKTKAKIKAIIATHIFGNMVDMKKLMPLALKYNLKVIEDATEALGTYELESSKYAGTFGDFGVYSFNGNKIITTGGGGALTAQKKEDVQKARYLSTQAKDDDIYFIHNEIGYNYRMTNLQAALGVAQLEQLENFIEIKKENFNFYVQNGLNLLPFDSNTRPNYWFYSFLTEKRDELIKHLSKNNIQARPLWKLIHTLKPYEFCQAYKIEKAFEFYEKIVNIPCSSNLKEEDITRIVETIKEIL